MKKFLSMVLAMMMVMSVVSLAGAEQQYFGGGGGAALTDPTTFEKPYEVNEVIVEADETTGQVRLEARTF